MQLLKRLEQFLLDVHRLPFGISSMITYICYKYHVKKSCSILIELIHLAASYISINDSEKCIIYEIDFVCM